MNFTKALIVALAASMAAGCLSDPELKECFEFQLGTTGEGCGNSDCDVYCDVVEQFCPGLFSSRAVCIDECGTEPVNPQMSRGRLDERANNTISCRITYALEGQCADASLTESTQCVGASCEEYCQLMEDNCPGAYPANSDTCERSCSFFVSGDPDENANTVDCRFRFAQEAALDPGGPACDAASLNGGGVCGNDPCIPYCDLVMANCTGEFAVYTSREACLDVCPFMNTEGRFNDWETQADSVQCRSYHASTPAADIPATHCKHTRVYNEEQCGIPAGPLPDDWPCITFCRALEKSCPLFPTPFPDAQACRTACAALPEVITFDQSIGPLIFPVSTQVCPVF